MDDETKKTGTPTDEAVQKSYDEFYNSRSAHGLININPKEATIFDLNEMLSQRILSLNQGLVYRWLFVEASLGGCVTLEIARTADQLRVKPTTVRSGIRGLVQKGFIQKVFSIGHRNQTHIYFIPGHAHNFGLEGESKINPWRGRVLGEFCSEEDHMFFPEGE